MTSSSLALLCVIAFQSAEPDQAVLRSGRWLVREVAAWPREHTCYSCHNSGDAARVLYLMRRRGIAIQLDSIEATTDWLRHPQRWQQSGPAGEFRDQQLEAIQFRLAAAAGVSAGDRLDELLTPLLAQQADDGRWPVAEQALLGSPIVYGTHLATAMIIRELRRSPKPALREARRRAEIWLAAGPPRNVVTASAVLWGLDGSAQAAAANRARQLLLKAQNADGGWGPFFQSRSTVFDTALAVIALSGTDSAAAVDAARQGRRFLLSEQAEDGSWPETTRGSERESYAHRVSTTAWALHALLLTSRQQEQPHDHQHRGAGDPD